MSETNGNFYIVYLCTCVQYGIYSQSTELTRGLPELVQHLRL
jgi:hypothetical protein